MASNDLEYEDDMAKASSLGHEFNRLGEKLSNTVSTNFDSRQFPAQLEGNAEDFDETLRELNKAANRLPEFKDVAESGLEHLVAWSAALLEKETGELVEVAVKALSRPEVLLSVNKRIPSMACNKELVQLATNIDKGNQLVGTILAEVKEMSQTFSGLKDHYELLLHSNRRIKELQAEVADLRSHERQSSETRLVTHSQSLNSLVNFGIGELISAFEESDPTRRVEEWFDSIYGLESGTDATPGLLSKLYTESEELSLDDITFMLRQAQNTAFTPLLLSLLFVKVEKRFSTIEDQLSYDRSVVLLRCLQLFLLTGAGSARVLKEFHAKVNPFLVQVQKHSILLAGLSSFVEIKLRPGETSLLEEISRAAEAENKLIRTINYQLIPEGANLLVLAPSAVKKVSFVWGSQVTFNIAAYFLVEIRDYPDSGDQTSVCDIDIRVNHHGIKALIHRSRDQSAQTRHPFIDGAS